MRAWSMFRMLIVGALIVASPAAAEVLGDTTSDSKGAGKIQFEVDPTADPQYVAGQINDNVRITEGGTLKAVTVENGVAKLEFDSATANVLVEAVLDDDIALLLKGGAGAASGGGGSGAAFATVGVVVAGAVGYGIYEAVDDDDGDDQPTGSPGQ